MKKLAYTFLLLSVIFPLTVNAQVAIGSRSEEVKEIQEILKADPEIYPEGYVTGYYGPLTEKAIRKLQKRCGVSETGAIDENTERCIYPISYGVKVVYPNGGEVLDRSQIQTVRWEVIEPEARIPEIAPYWSKASIDLFREVEVGVTTECIAGQACPPIVGKRVFVKHLATVNLFDYAYSGKIPSDIPNGKGYVIRISLGKNIVPLWYREKIGQPLPQAGEIWPTPPIVEPYITWDESDAPFEITGTVQPRPNLEEVIAILEKMIAELQKAIVLLRGVSQ